MHALVHVGDRITRGFEQRVATAFGLAQAGLEQAHTAAHVQAVELAAHDSDELLAARAQGYRIGAVAQGVRDIVLIQCIENCYQRDVLAAAAGRLHDVRKRQRCGCARKDEIGCLRLQQLVEICRVARKRRAHADAGIAQHARQPIGVLERILDQQQLDGFSGLVHWALRFIR